ncbi:MAG TPA: IclR family transcriptional regulator [Candidatus Dormibacteraeota bacterium]|nr:IclR family transcriptional regulator [Candidatus Dormibacteraeota bacterium]
MARQLLSSVRSAARLLCTFTATDRELGVSELARRLGLGKSTVHRLLTTLAAEHLVELNPRSGRYRLGIKLYELGTVVSTHFELHEAVAMYIDDLRASTGETVQVGVLDGCEVVYIERRESLRTLRHMVDLGHRNMAHCTACGKVLLASLPDVELDRMLRDAPLPARTPNSITDPARLRLELAAVRERGFAENVAESATDTASVAAPIHDDGGRAIAAISVAGPLSRMGEPTRRRYATIVLDTAARISEQLGYRRSHPQRRQSA